MTFGVLDRLRKVVLQDPLQLSLPTSFDPCPDFRRLKLRLDLIRDAADDFLRVGMDQNRSCHTGGITIQHQLWLRDTGYCTVCVLCFGGARWFDLGVQKRSDALAYLACCASEPTQIQTRSSSHNWEPRPGAEAFESASLPCCSLTHNRCDCPIDGRRSWSWELSDAVQKHRRPWTSLQSWLTNDFITLKMTKFSADISSCDQVSTARCSPIVAWCANPAGQSNGSNNGHVFTNQLGSAPRKLWDSASAPARPWRRFPWEFRHRGWWSGENMDGAPTRSQHGPFGEQSWLEDVWLNYQQPISFKVFSCGGWTLNQ